MKRNTILLLIAQIPILVFCQVIKIPMKNYFEGDKTFTFICDVVKNVQNQQIYSGLDTLNYKKHSIKYVSFNGLQNIAENVLNGSLKKKDFVEYVMRLGVDTNCIIYKHIERNSFAVFIGFDFSGLKHVIVDTNNNKRFDDDKEYIFNLEGDKKYPNIVVDIDYFDGTEIKMAKVHYTIDAYKESPYTENSLEKKMSLTLLLKYAKVGSFSIDSNKYSFKITDEYLNLYKRMKFSIDIRKIPLDSNDKNNFRYSSEDTLILDNKGYIVDNLTTDTLYLKRISNAKVNFGQLNTYAPNILGTNIISRQLFSLNSKKGKYLLLDFWGTWCTPCVEALPKLVQLHQKYKNKGIEFVSLAYDRKRDLVLLAKIIKDKQLDWIHLFIDKADEKNILKDYKIQEFPTTILINPKGKVIARGVGASILYNIDKLLQSELKN